MTTNAAVQLYAEAQKVVIDVAMKRKSHPRGVLAQAVAVLEEASATPEKKKKRS